MNFPDALQFVLAWEGLYSDDPDDPGGQTVWGISRVHNPDWYGWHTVDRCANLPEFPECLNKEPIMEAAVSQHYRENYWSPAHCDQLHDSLRLPQFDASVQHGSRQAIKLFQRACKIKADGKVGPVTRSHFKLHGSELLVPMLARRAVLYARIPLRRPSSVKYLYGWFRRLITVARTS